MKTIRKFGCVFLALLLLTGLGSFAFASGEPSGEASGVPMGGGAGGNTAIPADVADLPTIEAEYWVTTTEDRVGMEGPVFDFVLLDAVAVGELDRGVGL